jgi:hypothetical protein
MREGSLLCQLKRHLVPTTDSAHSLRSYPNLIKDVEPDGPDRIWLSDITYIRLPTAFCYLAAVVDAYSRYWWVGLCRAGLTRALRFRRWRQRSGCACRSWSSYIISPLQFLPLTLELVELHYPAEVSIQQSLVLSFGLCDGLLHAYEARL